jgi:hypothetical protein
MQIRRLSAPVLILIAALLPAAGCRNQFQEEWKRSATAEGGDGGGADHLAGRWKGSWKSDKSGHSGGLRCIVKRADADTYRAHFNATYALFIRFGYDMDMTADVQEDVTYVAGEADLGKSAGGVYEYEGQSDGKTFRLNYRTKKDYGHFTLKRP